MKRENPAGNPSPLLPEEEGVRGESSVGSYWVSVAAGAGFGARRRARRVARRVGLAAGVPVTADWVPVARPGLAAVPPVTPVPPAGVPCELLGVVLLGTPPAGPTVAPWARASSIPKEVAIVVASKA